jgi:hypothetical protein
MTATSGPLGRVALGLGLVVAAVNLLWLESTLHVLNFVLRDDLARSGVAEALVVVSVLPPLLFLVGECFCLAAPGRRSALFVALPLTVLALSLSTWINAPSWHGLLHGVRATAWEPLGEERRLLRLLAVLLGGGAHAAFLFFLHQLARSIDHERLAARAFVLFKGTLVLLGVMGAVLFGANETGLMIGTVGVLLAGLVWLYLYSFLLLHLREAALHAAGRSQGGRRG